MFALVRVGPWALASADRAQLCFTVCRNFVEPSDRSAGTTN